MSNQWGPFSVTGKSVIVTGAAMGIGLGIAQRFAEGGADVLVADLNHAEAALSLKKLKGAGRFAAMGIDVGEETAGEAMVALCVKEFGKLDVLVNNAGIYPQMPMLQMPHELWDKVQRVNLRGLAFACQAAGRYFMNRGRGGCIVNVASVDSVHPSMVGLAAYDASKGGVLSFSKNFALEMAPYKVRVNMVEPGAIATPGTAAPLEGSGMSPVEAKIQMEAILKAKIPMQRMGDPDDIAKAAVFLASDAASYMTGSSVVVDGGMLLA